MNGSKPADGSAAQPDDKSALALEYERRPWSEALRGRRLAGLAAKMAPKRPAGPSGPPGGDDFLPLVIGVTGHRDLRPEELPALRAALDRVFADLQSLCPQTPLMLLSPLAEGADRLAAETFLAGPGRRLAVPLPLEIDQYRKSFTEDDGDFDRLLARAEKSFLIPGPADRPSGATVDYRLEPFCYQALGAYLAEHCHIIIALWDGRDSGKAGGCSQIVAHQLSGRGLLDGNLEEEFEPAPGRPVIHIQAGRRGGDPAAVPGQVELLSPKGKSEVFSLFRLTADRLDRFNRGPSGREAAWLWPADREDEIGPTGETIVRLQARAEALAGRWSRRLRRRLVGLFAGGWLALGAFQGYRLLHAFRPELSLWPLVLVSGLAAVWVVLAYAQAQLGGWQNRHLSYRALAEALRVRFYWKILQVERSAARESFIGEGVKDFGEVRWLRLALFYTEIIGEGEKEPPAGGPERHRLARDLWLKGQEDFFSRKKKEARRKKALCLWPAIILLSLGTIWFILGKFLREVGPGSQAPLFIFLSFIMLGAALEAFHRLSGQVGEHRKWLALALGLTGLPSALIIFPQVPLAPLLSLFLSTVGLLLLGSGGLLLAYLKMSAHSDNADRYAEYERLFRRAGELLDQGRPEAEVLGLLGRKALAENSAWLRQHLERPLNMPLS